MAVENEKDVTPPAPVAQSEIDADKVKEKKTVAEPVKQPFFYQATIFFRLLFAAQPTWLDIVLILSGTLFAIAAGTPFPLIAIVFGQLVDELNGATCAAESDLNAFDYEREINEKIALMVYIAIGAFVLIYAYITIWGVISQRLAHRMRVVYLQALLRQPPSFFDARSGGQDVSSSLHSDIAAIQAGTSEKVGIFITSISFFVTSFIIAFIKQAKLAGMLTSMVPAFLLMSIFGGAFFGKYAGMMSESFASASSLAGECLSNISVVQAFGASARLESKFALLTSDASKNGIKKAGVAAVQAGLLYFIAYAGNALAFWQGSILVADTADGHGDGTSVGSIYTVIMILVDACVMLGNTAPILPLFGGASAAYQRLLRDIEEPSLIDGTSDQGEFLPVDLQSVDVSFENVSFAYPSRPDQPVLQSVDLSFPTGRYTAVVGLSGSGKSTVAALLSRLYDPTEGSIFIGGHDVKYLNVRSLRGLMGFVQQEPSLMNGSVFSNIARGLINSPNPSHAHLKEFLYSAQMDELCGKGRDIDAEARNFGTQAEEIVRLVHYAAEQADAASFIDRLENGYGTSVGPKGSLLSGGQRQRVALAQALIRDPRILVLDEATSALDSASERRIQEAIERAAKHRTVICIAHRLSTIRNADTIIVMEAGKVVEQGSYSELMARGGTTFERMVKLQSLAHKDKGEGGSISGDSLGASTLKADTIVSEKNEKIEDEELKKEKVEKSTELEVSTSPLDATQPVGSVTRTLARFIRPSLPWLLVAMGAAVIVGLTFPSSGTIIGITVGELNPCSNTSDHIRYNGRLFGGLLFMLAVVELFANFAAWACFGVVAERLLYLLRVLSFRSLMEQDIHWHQAESPAKLLAIITKDSAAVGGFSGSTLGTVFSILVNFVAAIVLSHIIAWKIAVVCLASVPILLGTGFMQLRMLARYEERTADAFANAAAVAVEAVQSIRTVAVLSLEKETMTIFSRLLRPPQQQILRASASTNIWLAMTHSTGKLVYCLTYWWGSRFIMRGEYTQSQFFIVLISMLVSAQLWATMFNLAPEFSRARTAMSRTMNIINLGSTKDISTVVGGGKTGATRKQDIEANGETPSPIQPGENRGVSIKFDKVSFAYPNRPDVPVLDEVSLTIQPGQFVGLVGPSGAGKSTIMSLVQRLYTPTSGVISLDDRDISSINTAAFRDSIALVPQDPTLFNGTVRFNVSLGAAPDHEATDEEIEEACRLANIHHVIEALPEGYNTECGSGASRLSGGQRQRLAIARALVRRPRLLLLDESTSALDAESEAALQEGLERASRGTTVLAITHRLHTVQKANVIFVVEGGRIVDSGRHAELMERSATYNVNATQQMLQ